MFRHALIAAAVLLTLPGAPRAHDRDDHDRDFDEEWGYIDEGPGSDVDVSMDTGGTVSFEVFEENLSPHGEWVSVSGHGRAWRPRHVASGWRPYYNGHWAWTDEGWLWVSDEPWGWATYHYGRWALDSSYGWVWVPGYQWAPAWVSWRVSADYIGWAPLGPGLSVYVTSYPVVHDHWCFVPSTRFVAVPVPGIAHVGAGRVGRIWGGTQAAPPRSSTFGSPAPAWGGPARPFVERRGGRPVTPVRVQAVGTPQAVAAPSRAGVVSVYRPEVSRRAPGGRGAAAAPSGRGSAVSSEARSGGAAGVAPARPWGEGRGSAPAAPPSAGQGQARGRDDVGGDDSRRAAPAPRSEARGAAPAAAPPPSAPPAPSRGSEQRGGAQRGSEQRGGGAAPSAPSRGAGGGWAPAPSRGGGGEPRGGGARGGGQEGRSQGGHGRSGAAPAR